MIVYRVPLRINQRMVKIPTEFDVSRCKEAFSVMEADVDRLTTALTNSQFHAPPRAGGWSVGFCIEHLIVVGYQSLLGWDTAIRAAPPTGPGHREPARYGWFGRSMLYAMEPPYKLKMRSSEVSLPRLRRPMAETIAHFRKMHQEFGKCIESSQSIDLKRARVQSPFRSWLSYDLGLSFDLALAHERRHLWQAWQVRAQIINQTRDTRQFVLGLANKPR